MTRQEAARHNGALSKGPVTPAGKAISARNALKHGLCAAPCQPLFIPDVMLVNESQQAFQAFLAAMMAKYRPADVEESADVVIYCNSFWRWNRATEFEAAAINRKLLDLAAEPGISEASRSQLAFSQAHNEDKSFANLPLYETRLERIYDKARRRIQVLLLRQGVASEAAGPASEPPAASTTVERTNEPVAASPARRQMHRNARCHCGSGFKYKHCCGGVRRNRPKLEPPIPIAA